MNFIRKASLIAVIILYATILKAQFSITGKITNAENNEALTGANIYLIGTTLGAASDNNGEFKIRLNTDLYNKVNIQVYNAMGQIMKTQLSTGLTYGSVVSVDLGTLPSGTYHLFLTNDQNGFVKRSSSFVVYK
jgi:hypothetical protein